WYDRFAMRITLNGEPREMMDGHSVASLLAHLGIPAERVAVELNLTVVDRQPSPGTPLRDGERVEVIGFIGGGEDTRHERWPVDDRGHRVPFPTLGGHGQIQGLRRDAEGHRGVRRGRGDGGC